MNVNFHISKDKCIACRSAQFLQFYELKKCVSFAKNETMVFDQRLECCYSCGLVRQEINETYLDKKLAKYYNKSFRTPLHPPILNKADKRVQNARKRLQFIKKFKSSGTLLEIGFGDGVFLGLAAKSFLCSGLDPSAGYDYLYEHLVNKDIEISNKPLDKFSSNKKFDIVCSFLVLEHIKDPLAFIKLQIKYLSPGGILVIEVPDINKYAFFNSESVITHEHLYHYCIESLSLLLSQINLELIASNNKDISYGFSLIAAFRVKRKINPPTTTSGFRVLNIFQDFLQLRKRYRQQMTMGIGNIIKVARSKKQKVAVYGTGFLFYYALDNGALKIHDIDLLFDDTEEKLGSAISGRIINPLAEIKKHNPGVVLIFSEMFFEPMKQNVLSALKKNIPILNIHQLSI